MILSLIKKLLGISSSENLTKLIQEGAYLIDVRTAGEFSQGSVKGAVNIPLDTIEKNVSKLKDRNHIIVFCRSGARSGQAKSILNRNNIHNVTNGGSWLDVKQYVG